MVEQADGGSRWKQFKDKTDARCKTARRETFRHTAQRRRHTAPQGLAIDAGELAERCHGAESPEVRGLASVAPSSDSESSESVQALWTAPPHGLSDDQRTRVRQGRHPPRSTHKRPARTLPQALQSTSSPSSTPSQGNYSQAEPLPSNGQDKEISKFVE